MRFLRSNREYLRRIFESRTISGQSWYSRKQISRRIVYALQLLYARLFGPAPKCPYCGATQYRHLGDKFILLAAKQCDFCRLIFRWPIESEDVTKRYYDRLFKDSWEDTTGIRTEIESGKMEQFIAAKFQGVKYDYYHKLKIVRELTGGTARGKFLDFGCGWGYITFQARELGWDAEGFDVNGEYLTFARENLGITIHTDSEFVTNPAHYKRYDVVFAHHVLEHLVTPRQTLDTLYQLLKPGGWLVLVVPNAAGDAWHHNAAQTLGQNHISAFTPEWFRDNLPKHGFMVTRIISPPYVFADTEKGFAETVGIRGFEIMAVCRRPASQ